VLDSQLNISDLLEF